MTVTDGQGNYNFVATVSEVELTFATANVSAGDTTLTDARVVSFTGMASVRGPAAI